MEGHPRKAAAAARQIAQAEARLVEAANAFTRRTLVDAGESRSPSLRRESYRKEATARVRQGLATLLDRPAGKITRTEAARALEEIAEQRGQSPHGLRTRLLWLGDQGGSARGQPVRQPGSPGQGTAF